MTELLKALDHLLTPGIAVLMFLLGKATKGGANQTLLDQHEERLKGFEATQTQHSTMLASHTTLHAGYAETNKRIESALQEQNRLLGNVIGRLDSRGGKGQ